MIYKVSTTGVVSEVILYDMGERTLVHPTVSLDLGLEYTDDEIIDSEDLAEAIEEGWLTLDDVEGRLATEEYVDASASGILGSIITTFTGLDDVPSTYSGEASYIVAVNDTEDGVEFIPQESISVIFGSEYHYEEEEAETSTSRSFQSQGGGGGCYGDDDEDDDGYRECHGDDCEYGYLTRLTLDTDTVASGTYRIGWYYEWKRNKTSTDFMATVTVDDVTLMDHRQEAKDKHNWNTAAGFKHIALGSGTHTIKLGYCGSRSPGVSYIRRVRVEFWRMT